MVISFLDGAGFFLSLATGLIIIVCIVGILASAVCTAILIIRGIGFLFNLLRGIK